MTRELGGGGKGEKGKKKKRDTTRFILTMFKIPAIPVGRGGGRKKEKKEENYVSISIYCDRNDKRGGKGRGGGREPLFSVRKEMDLTWGVLSDPKNSYKRGGEGL